MISQSFNSLLALISEVNMVDGNTKKIPLNENLMNNLNVHLIASFYSTIALCRSEMQYRCYILFTPRRLVINYGIQYPKADNSSSMRSRVLFTPTFGFPCIYNYAQCMHVIGNIYIYTSTR